MFVSCLSFPHPSVLLSVIFPVPFAQMFLMFFLFNISSTSSTCVSVSLSPPLLLFIYWHLFIRSHPSPLELSISSFHLLSAFFIMYSSSAHLSWHVSAISLTAWASMTSLHLPTPSSIDSHYSCVPLTYNTCRPRWLFSTCFRRRLTHACWTDLTSFSLLYS